MKTKYIEVRLHITEEIENDTALLAAQMRLRRCSRAAMKLRQQYITARSAMLLVSSVGEVPSELVSMLADLRDRLSVAERNELQAEQLWEKAYEKAES